MYLELEDEPFHNLFYTLIDTSGEVRPHTHANVQHSCGCKHAHNSRARRISMPLLNWFCARCTWSQGWIGFEEWVLSLSAFLGALELDDLIDFSMRLFDWWASRVWYT